MALPDGSPTRFARAGARLIAERAGPQWLRDFFPGIFALVMATGILSIAAHLLRYDIAAWPLLIINLVAYPVLWLILLARFARFPRVVLREFESHNRGPAFLTLAAATGIVGSQLAGFGVLEGLVAPLLWLTVALWAVLTYAFLSTVTVRTTKPDLEHGLNGAWLLLVVATESVAVLGSIVAVHANQPPALVFACLAFYLLGAMLYILLAALIFFRWVFRPMHPAEMGAPWWINMGAVAIATLAGARIMLLHGLNPSLAGTQHFVGTFTVMLWATSTFWMPLLLILFVWKELRRGLYGYDHGVWSVVFPLGMYATATHVYAAAARLPFLEPISEAVFWVALLAWVLSFIGMWVRLRAFGQS